jgi:hypothetical protein
MKAVNDLARPDGIMLILLVFKAYLCITRDSLLSPFITEQAKAIYKAIKEVRRFYAEQQVNNALAIKNRPNTKPVTVLAECHLFTCYLRAPDYHCLSETR